MADWKRGVVKWFNNAKGFGFIKHESGADVFVHYSAIEQEGYKTLKDGEEVQYEVTEGPKGFHAMRVQRPNAPVTETAQEAPKTIQPLAAQIQVSKETEGSASEESENSESSSLESSGSTETPLS